MLGTVLEAEIGEKIGTNPGQRPESFRKKNRPVKSSDFLNLKIYGMESS
tara:strand:+ start:117 stop:263 length:147 start_codon:yes stop_codon:yes gene_type:complete